MACSGTACFYFNILRKSCLLRYLKRLLSCKTNGYVTHRNINFFVAISDWRKTCHVLRLFCHTEPLLSQFYCCLLQIILLHSSLRHPIFGWLWFKKEPLKHMFAPGTASANGIASTSICHNWLFYILENCSFAATEIQFLNKCKTDFFRCFCIAYVVRMFCVLSPWEANSRQHWRKRKNFVML
jgi:hypothetical protein